MVSQLGVPSVSRNKMEAWGRTSLPLIATLARSQWHVTVTFEGSLHPDKIARADKNRRSQDLQNLYLCLDFDRLQLIDNTVTELLIKREHDNTPPVTNQRHSDLLWLGRNL
jgi:hypothetical protein